MPVEKRVVDGVSLAYRVSGDAGGRPIVLIHGLTASSRDWFMNVKPLVDSGWRVLTPESPGHGDSDAPDDSADYTMLRVADRLQMLATGLGFAPAVIVGHSMGGAVAEEYAVRHGADVTALVLVGSAGGSPRAYKPTPESRAFATEERALLFERGIEAVWNLHQERGMWASVRQMPEEAQAWFKARFLRCSPRGYAYGDDGMQGRRNTIEDLRRFTKPALVIHGEHEESLMKGTSAELAAALPNATLVEIPKAAHSPQFENAAEFNRILLDFLKNLP